MYIINVPQKKSSSSSKSWVKPSAISRAQKCGTAFFQVPDEKDAFHIASFPQNERLRHHGATVALMPFCGKVESFNVGRGAV